MMPSSPFCKTPGTRALSLHKLDKLKTKGFWSLYVSMDLRMILYRAP
jgi:hypothetical protein